MAGMGPPPKPAATRARKNRVTTAAVLHAPDPEDVIVPPLPDRPQDWHHPLVNRSPQEWHPLTRAWWADLWASPMAAEYDATDVHGLLQLAVLVDDFWHAETPRDRQAASAEIRLQGVRFGLSPIDRRRLQWEIKRIEQAQARGWRRPATRPPQDDPTGPPWPRTCATSSDPSQRPESPATEDQRNTMTDKTQVDPLARRGDHRASGGRPERPGRPEDRSNRAPRPAAGGTPCDATAIGTDRGRRHA